MSRVPAKQLKNKKAPKADSETLESSWNETMAAEARQELSFARDYLPDYDLFVVLNHYEEGGKALAYELIQKAIDEHETLADEYVGHVYGLFVVAEMKDQGAFPLILKLAALPGESLEILLGDLMSDPFGGIMASVCGGDLKAIQNLIEDSNTYIWMKHSAIQCLMTLVNTKQLERAWLVEYFAKLMDLKSVNQDPLLMAFIVNMACDLYPEELMPKIKHAFEAKQVDEIYILFEEVEEQLALGKKKVLELGLENYQLIDDAIGELSKVSFSGDDEDEEDAEMDDSNPAPQTFQHVAIKVGRNEPCPCGSGKKHKNCCLSST